MVKLIVDTDIGADCDDAGALAVMHKLADNGLCEILAITHCLSTQCGAAAIDAINRYYGRPDIPIGTLKKEGYYSSFFKNPEDRTYGNALQEEFETAYPPGAECEDAVVLLRRTLANAEDGSITFVSIGPFTVLRYLLESMPDKYSKLDGTELFNRKVKTLCSMGGYFAAEEITPYSDDLKYQYEYNITEDLESIWLAALMIDVPWVFAPVELGNKIITGDRMVMSHDKKNPVCRSYEIFTGKGRESWDLCTMLYAVSPEMDFWKLSAPGWVEISEKGFTRYRADESGKRYVLSAKNFEDIRILLDGMLEAKPANKSER